MSSFATLRIRSSALRRLSRLGDREALPVADPVPLDKAFVGEKVRLQIEVAEGSHGKKLRVTLENKTEQALRVMIPKGKTELPAGGMPLDTLTVVSPSERTIEVPAAGSADPVDLGQAGAMGALEGKFSLSVYEGTPLFSGSITSGPFEKE